MVSSAHPGYLLRAWREANDVTQVVLAGRLDISPKHLSGVENGDRSVSLNLAIRIERELGIPVESWERAEKASAA